MGYRPARYLEGVDIAAASGVGGAARFDRTLVRAGVQRGPTALAHAPAPMRRTLAAGLRRVLPRSDAGPTGYFLTDWQWEVCALARTHDGRTGEACLTGQGHPGYTAIAAMIAEVGLRLALDRVPQGRHGCLIHSLVFGSLDLAPWFVGSLHVE